MIVNKGFSAQRLALVFVLSFAFLLPHIVRGSTWKLELFGESGSPSGVVRVREDQIVGTRFDLRHDLGIDRVTTFGFRAVRPVGEAGAIHLRFTGTTLSGSATLADITYFNGTTLEPGRVSSGTRFLDDWRFEATYWRRVAHFANGGSLWLSGGLTFVSLNFKLKARVAADSVRHETKEDFNTQELPIPIVGVHLDYPVGSRLDLLADLEGGHLPWVSSFRYEGGLVKLTQTHEDVRLGLRYRFSPAWGARLYWFHYAYQQHERSHEDGNFIRLNQQGIGFGIGRGF